MGSDDVFVLADQLLAVGQDRRGDRAFRLRCSDGLSYVWASDDLEAKVVRLRTVPREPSNGRLLLDEVIIALGTPSSVEIATGKIAFERSVHVEGDLAAARDLFERLRAVRARFGLPDPDAARRAERDDPSRGR